MAMLGLRYDLRAPSWGSVNHAELYATCLDQARWGDERGIDFVVLSEHHGADDGYVPAPVTMAAAIAGRTRRIGINIAAILVPLQCEFFALEGLSQLLQTVEQVRSTLNPNLSIHGIVLTMFDSRNNLSNQVVADVRQFMGGKVYNTMIPRNVRISEAPSYGKPVLVYDLKCVGSEAYLKLATEVIQRERDLRANFEIPGSRLTTRPGMTARSTDFWLRSDVSES